MRLLFVIQFLLFGILYVEGAEAPTKPNVLFILADDLGIGDLACYGNPIIDTPAIDQLAKKGIRLTRHYAPSPLCSPSRAGYLTGRFNHRTGAIDVPSNRGLDRIELSEKTFGDYFKHAGYKTALIGKWHNGLYCRDYLPHQRGFDMFFGFPNGGQDYWKWNLMRNDEHIKHDGRYMTDVFNEEAISYMKERAKQKEPFAMFLSHHAPHSPFQAPKELIKKYQKKLKGNITVPTIYAMIEQMDRGLKEVFALIKNDPFLKNTIIVFTSDNGAILKGKSSRYNGGFKGHKDQVTEQGIRVPCIVSWPNHFLAGKEINTAVHGCDWLPTLFSLTGASIPKNSKPIDGYNIVELLKSGKQANLENRLLPFQKNRYRPVAHSNASMMKGHWKLFWPGIPGTITKEKTDNAPYRKGLVKPHWEMPIDASLRDNQTEYKNIPRLYRLDKDPYENNDLARQHPELVKELSVKYNQWFSEVMKEWESSRKSIEDHDVEYWKNKKSNLSN